tara:strand:+ start:89 stop:850 length:762 start_codon:yes stop_codon:yes gene_type:complete
MSADLFPRPASTEWVYKFPDGPCSRVPGTTHYRFEHPSNRFVKSPTGNDAAAKPSTPSTVLPSKLASPDCVIDNFDPARPPLSPLDALGDTARATFDEIGHLRASVKAHLPPQMLRLVKMPESLRKLDAVIARDIHRAVKAAFENGVRHGEWLKEAQAARGEQGTEARAMLSALQLSHALLQDDHRRALRAIAEFPSTVPLVEGTVVADNPMEVAHEADEILSATESCDTIQVDDLLGCVEWLDAHDQVFGGL